MVHTLIGPRRAKAVAGMTNKVISQASFAGWNMHNSTPAKVRAALTVHESNVSVPACLPIPYHLKKVVCVSCCGVQEIIIPGTANGRAGTSVSQPHSWINETELTLEIVMHIVARHSPLKPACQAQ